VLDGVEQLVGFQNLAQNQSWAKQFGWTFRLGLYTVYFDSGIQMQNLQRAKPKKKKRTLPEYLWL
jgi:hypothetical protein